MIDLRSDTVTRPSAEMRRAMADAVVGDDVLDGDPTTKRLEARVAELFGCEAALFFPSGTQANQAGVNVLTQPGTELICDSRAHVVLFEKAGLAANSGVQPHTVQTERGFLSGDDVSASSSDSPYLSRASAVAMENTHNVAGGLIATEDQMKDVSDRARSLGLGVHLDGARIWNAAAAGAVQLENLGRYADTVMACFSKGMGCPAGSCLAGRKDLIDEAWHVRKRMGGGMRQSGILAAACLFALDHLLDRVADDYEAARQFAGALEGHPRARASEPETNMVMVELLECDNNEALSKLAENDVLLVPMGPKRLRAVTHLDVSVDDARRAGEILGEVL